MVVDLPAPFGPEEAVHLAGPDLQVEPVERARAAERLDQPGLDHFVTLLQNVRFFQKFVKPVECDL